MSGIGLHFQPVAGKVEDVTLDNVTINAGTGTLTKLNVTDLDVTELDLTDIDASYGTIDTARIDTGTATDFDIARVNIGCGTIEGTINSGTADLTITAGTANYINITDGTASIINITSGTITDIDAYNINVRSGTWEGTISGGTATTLAATALSVGTGTVTTMMIDTPLEDCRFGQYYSSAGSAFAGFSAGTSVATYAGTELHCDGMITVLAGETQYYIPMFKESGT